MKPHPNSRTNPHSRAQLVRLVRQEHWTAAEAAEVMGISRTLVYRWLRRHSRDGLSGLRERSSRALRIVRTSRLREHRIVALRRRRLTAAQIASRLAMARSTVAAVLKRRGLERLSRLTPRPVIVRYERQRAGELLHVDVKKLARFRRVGHRIHGDRTRHSRPAGWEFVHVCIDDHSRLAYVEILGDERALSTTAFLRRAVRWFRQQGVHAERVMTDNGSGYRAHDFARACRELGLRHLRTRPYTPRTNGKAERFIQTLMREWAYERPYRSSLSRADRLVPWLSYYNHKRPHSALGGRSPISRIRSNP